MAVNFTGKSSATYTAPADLGVRLAKKLSSVLSQLSKHDQPFAMSLIDFAKKNGKLSDKQIVYAQKMIDGVNQPKLKAEIAKLEVPSDNKSLIPKLIGLPDYEGINTLFDTAAEKLKTPVFTLEWKGQPIELRRVISKLSGIPYVAISNGVPHSNPARAYFGRVTSKGVFHAYSGLQERDVNELAAFLKMLADNPTHTVAEYGKLSGKCCFCNHKLTDELSTANGYGPVCAKNWGLKWKTE